MIIHDSLRQLLEQEKLEIVPKGLVGALKVADSWGEVEDAVPERKEGRYGVMVFFDSTEWAEQFRATIAAATSI